MPARLRSVPKGLAAPSPSHAPIRPPRLKRGDLVRVVSMSGTFPKSAWIGVRMFAEALGLELQIGASMWKDPGYLGRDPRRRADDFNDAVEDPRVRAILLFRGGNSAAETLPWIDFAALRRHPKAVVGFSDHSSVVMAAHAQANLVTFLLHPSVFGPPSKKLELTIDSFRRILMEGESWVALPSLGTETWRRGTARGRILGANLRVLSYLMGTPYAPPLADRILCWEEIGESVQDLNTIFTQLRNAGAMSSLAGIVVGHLEGIKAREDGFSVREHLLEKFAGPVMKTRAYGHFRPCFALPLGVRAALDAGRKTLVLEEPAVD